MIISQQNISYIFQGSLFQDPTYTSIIGKQSVAECIEIISSFILSDECKIKTWFASPIWYYSRILANEYSWDHATKLLNFSLILGLEKIQFKKVGMNIHDPGCKIPTKFSRFLLSFSLLKVLNGLFTFETSNPSSMILKSQFSLGYIPFLN